MNIVIVEDEIPAYNRMAKLVKEIIPIAKIVSHHDSVQSAWKWFSQNPLPDLVFLDIQLADGSAFDLLKLIKIDCVIIFTTAYDKYAIEAFKANCIDYLLKPVKKTDLEKSLQKIKEFQSIFRSQEPALHTTAAPVAEYRKRFVVRFGENIKTVITENIAYCSSENKATFATTFDGHKYPMDYNLDALEKMVDPQNFFRINRQYLINLKAISDMKIYTKARVIIKLNPPVKDPPIVSSERASDFKQWLSGEL